MTSEDLLRSLFTWPFGGVVAIALVLGAIGGLVHRETTPPSPDGGLPPPSAVKQATVGAVAALAVLAVANPTSALGFVGGSLVAGYAGQAVLAGLQARVLATIAQQQAMQAKRQLAEVTDAAAALRATSDQPTAFAQAARRLDELIASHRNP